MEASQKNNITIKNLFDKRSYLFRRINNMASIIDFSRTTKKEGINRNSYGGMLEYSATKFPNNTALRYEDLSISFFELNEQVNKYANFLLSRGVSKGDSISLFMKNRPDYIISVFAIVKLGAVASLINNSLTGESLLHSINLTNPKTAIIGKELIPEYNAVRERSVIKNEIYFVPDGDSGTDLSDEAKDFVNISHESRDHSTHNPILSSAIGLDDPCLYIYTSGTTGLPKASVQRHKRLILGCKAAMVINDLKPTDVLYCSLPLYHGTALGICYSAAMVNGASFIVSRKFSASNFWGDIEKYQATAFGYVGELCRYLIHQPESTLDAHNSLRVMIGNGLKEELWGEFKSRFNIEEVREFYGASEGNVVSVNIFNIDNTVGFVLSPYAVVEFNPELDEPILDAKGRMIRVKKGEAGLLLGKITSRTPFDGYTEKKATQGKLFRGVFKNGDEWFNTGDLIKELGCRHIQFVDRTGDTYRWKGENVSTSEVEKVANNFPEIGESVAYGVEIPRTDGRAGMISITLKNKQSTFDKEEFFVYLQQQLPSYAVPVFVRINKSFEKTGTFKYQKGSLKKEGFNVREVKAPMQVALPGKNTYIDLTENILSRIENNEFSF